MTAVLSQFVRAATEHQFAIHAYVFMPDHTHLLVEGKADTSDLRAFVKIAKRRSGYEHAKGGNGRLWQPSYFERVLREEESTPRVVAYLFNNPIAAGLATRFGEYRFAGSDTVSVDSIAEMLRADPALRGTTPHGRSAGLQACRKPEAIRELGVEGWELMFTALAQPPARNT